MEHGHARFRRVISEAAVAYARRVADFSSPAFKEVFRNHLFGLPGPTELSRKLSRDEQYFRAAMNHCREIERAADSIRDITVFIRRFPYSGTGVSRVRYLRHNIESYLQDVYILRERLNSFLPVLKKKFRFAPQAGDISDRLDGLHQFVESTMKSMLAARSYHVHEYRYNEPDLDRLDTLELLVESSPEQVFDGYYQAEYRRIRRRWAATISASVESMDAILDGYFDMLSTFMIIDGQLVYPPAPPPRA